MGEPVSMMIGLPGLFTSATADAVSAEFESALSAELPCVLLDLSEVREMDSTAIDLLLEYTGKILHRDGILKIADMSPQAATLLEMTGVGRLLEAMPNDLDAVATFEAAAETSSAQLTEEPALQTSAA